MKSMLGGILKSFLPSLDDAIIRQDEWSVKKLLKLGEDPNKVNEDQCSALQVSFINHLDKFSFILLEYGANPNIDFVSTINGQRVPLLQNRLDWRCYDQAKLLILYGTNLENIVLSKIPLDVKKTMWETRDYYEKIKQLQTQDTKDAYQVLADIWYTISNNENNSTLKDCYRAKANSYRERIQLMENEHVANIPLHIKLKQN